MGNKLVLVGRNFRKGRTRVHGRRALAAGAHLQPNGGNTRRMLPLLFSKEQRFSHIRGFSLAYGTQFYNKGLEFFGLFFVPHATGADEEGALFTSPCKQGRHRARADPNCSRMAISARADLLSLT